MFLSVTWRISVLGDLVSLVEIEELTGCLKKLLKYFKVCLLIRYFGPRELTFISFDSACLRKHLAIINREPSDSFMDVQAFEQNCRASWVDYRTWLGLNATGARISRQQSAFEKAIATALITIQRRP